MDMSSRKDGLDSLLDESAPPTIVMTDDVVHELHALAQRAAAEADSNDRPRRSRWSRPVVAGVASIALLGGAAAAAAETGLWDGWARTPDAVATYTLPSGAQCEHRIGNVQGTDPVAVEIVQQYYRNTDVNSLIAESDLDAVIAEIRADDHRFVNEDGTEEPAGYGTEHYSADHEYSGAVSRILTEELDARLRAAGIDGATSDLSWDGSVNCPGADW